MACNSTIGETNVEGTGSKNETGGDQAEKKVKHCFSEPWKDTDVILVVEDEKFHVHRLILSLNSPVFEAMFKSQFKEATANEIPLPEKNASGVLDFLKKIYGFQYIQERVEITMENVEDLLQLSDEYQVKQLIFDPCVKFLEDQRKTKENVMEILALANLYNLEKVRQSCIDLLRNMRLESLSETVHLQDLDKEKTQYYLTKRIERLETFLDEACPQFFGIVASLMSLMHEAKKNVNWCSKHVSEGKFTRSIQSSLEITKCSGCSNMLSSMVRATSMVSATSMVGTTCIRGLSASRRSFPRLGGFSSFFSNHFDDNLFSVTENFVKLTEKRLTLSL